MDIVHKIARVEFGIMSPDEILNLSVCEVTKPVTYENGKAIPGGLNDKRMGVLEYGEKCETCNQSSNLCPGHHGHIVLEEAIFHPNLIRGTKMGNGISILKLLNCICFKCGKLLIDVPEDIQTYKMRSRMKYIQLLIKKRICQSKKGCGFIQPEYLDTKYNQILYKYKDASGAEKREELSPTYVSLLFKKISNETCRILGMTPERTRPEWFILKYLPVVPPCVRPVMKADGIKNEDDLVTGYISILKRNNELKKAKEKGSEKSIAEYTKHLNAYITALMTGRSKGDGEKSDVLFKMQGRPIKPIRERISGKEGRVRGNLLGKRVDFSARSVITPEPTYAIYEIGIPQEIAMRLTFPEVVTADNKEDLLRLIRNGDSKYPGASRFVKAGTKEERFVKIINKLPIVLSPGDIVHRHLQNGDPVIFNRQPSLHKMSMMAHRVRVLPGKTFRLNPSTAAPYNADYDGDEMNMHVPQSAKTQAEILEIASVPKQMIKGVTSTLAMGIIQDGLSGSYKLTSGKINDISKSRFYNIIAQNDKLTPVTLKKVGLGKELYTGYDVYTSILPDINYQSIIISDSPLAKNIGDFIASVSSSTDGLTNVNWVLVSENKNKLIAEIKGFMAKHKELSVADKQVSGPGSTEIQKVAGDLLTEVVNLTTNSTIDQIKTYINKIKGLSEKIPNKSVVTAEIDSGVLRYGRIAKSTIKAGGSDNNMIYITWHDCGPDSAADLTSNIQRVINNWLLEEGHTIGFADCIVLDHTVQQNIYIELLKMLDKYKLLEQDTYSGKLVPGVGRTYEEEFEYRAKMLFSGVFDGTVRKLLEKYIGNDNNNLNIMIASGGKGDAVNMTQMLGILGQQHIDNKRSPKVYNDRTLPHFEKHDNSPESRGFISHNFIHGLNPVEFILHAATGREGIIDTAIKTAECGYISRRLVKSEEDFMLHYDFRVVNSVGQVIQPVYGENSLDCIYTSKTAMDLLGYDNEKMEAEYMIQEMGSSKKESSKKGSSKSGAIFDADFKKLVYYREFLRNCVFKSAYESEFPCPFNAGRIILNAKRNVYGGETSTKLTPEYVLYMVNWLCKVLPKLFLNFTDEMPKYPAGAEEIYAYDSEFVDGEKLEDLLAGKFDVDNYLSILEKKIYISANKTRFEQTSQLIKIYIKSNLAPKKIISAGLVKEQFDYIISGIIYLYRRAIINPGENIGTYSAQSIGEPTTQATLNTFHQAGVQAKSAVITGLPRIKECLNVTKTGEIKTPMTEIYLDSSIKLNKYQAKIIANTVEYTTLRSFTKTLEVYFDPGITRTVVENDASFVKEYYKNSIFKVNTSRLSKFMVRLVLNKRKMIYKQMRMEFLKYKIEQYKGGLFFCVLTDDNAEELVMHVRINMDNISARQKNEYDIIMANRYVLLDLKIRGVHGITSAQIDNTEKEVSYNPETGKKSLNPVWMVYASGTNLKEILTVDGIDATKTISNDIQEVCDILGIEAGRKLLYLELYRTYSVTTPLNAPPLLVLVDYMSHLGKLIPISRNGVNRIEGSPLNKASFEETLEQLTTACIYGESDNMKGISANIMNGQLIPSGTGGLMDIIYK